MGNNANKSPVFRGVVTLNAANMQLDPAGGAIIRGVELLPVGHFWDPRYDEWDIEEKHLREMVANFTRTVMGAPGVAHELPINLEHEYTTPNAGWVKGIYLGTCRAGVLCLLGDLWVNAETTELIRQKKKRYISPEFFRNYPDLHGDGKKTVGAFLKAVAITDDPYLTGQAPLDELLAASGDAKQTTEKQPRQASAPAYFTRADGAVMSLVSSVSGGEAAFYLDSASPIPKNPTPRGAAKEPEMDEKEKMELSARATRAEEELQKLRAERDAEAIKLRAKDAERDTELVKLRGDFAKAQQELTATRTAVETERELRRLGEAEAFVGQQNKDGKIGATQKEFWLKSFLADEKGTREYFLTAPVVIADKERQSHAGTGDQQPVNANLQILRDAATEAHKANPGKSYAEHFRALVCAAGDGVVSGTVQLSKPAASK